MNPFNRIQLTRYPMLKKRISALIVLIIGIILAFGVIRSQSETAPAWLKKPFSLGLDLSGGTHLLYSADTSAVQGSVSDAMSSLRDVIERRVNLFGVGEPVVTVERSGTGIGSDRLAIDLPGVTDITEAIAVIGQTPFLEFRTLSSEPQEAKVGADGKVSLDINQEFTPTELTGKYLKKAQLNFDPNGGGPIVSLQFNDEGAKLFEQITKDNIGKPVAIYLDGSPISSPVVQQEIVGGQAQISGKFSVQEAKELVGRLNSGALPVPIKLVSTETIGATLGAQAVHDGMRAALIGFAIVALFLILWYRLPGLVAVLALILYVAITLTLYKLIPVTLSAAGIAGFIISIGMAVDANILIFERFREERQHAGALRDALHHGFERAWTSIRDANTASFIIAIILFWFGSSLIKGFALTFGLGVLVSLLTAISITRLFLSALPLEAKSKFGKFLFNSGFSKKHTI
jgi:protein-export membrane protein SecD